MEVIDKNLELLQGCHWLEDFEGYRPTVYLDTKNIETIGIGRNLEVFPLEPEELEPDGTYSHLSAFAWAYDLLETFRKDLIIALPWLVDHPPVVRLITTDMCFNLGLTGFFKFQKFIRALKNKDYVEAAKEIKDSKYFRDTGRRAQHHYDKLKELGCNY